MSHMENDLSSIYATYPTLVEVEKALASLSKIEWRRFGKDDSLEEYLQEMHLHLTHELKYFPRLVLSYQGAAKFPFKQFFRVRPANLIENFLNKKQFGYPPKCEESQRASLANHPVFYASGDPLTALREYILNNVDYAKEKNREYCIGSWSLINTPAKIQMAHFIYGNIGAENPLFKMSEFQDSSLERVFAKHLNLSQLNGLKEIHKFYTNIFLDDTNYAICAYLGHSFLFPNDTYPADVFVYPSVATKKESVNFAIPPSFVDQKMYLKIVYLCRVDDMKIKDGQLGSMTLRFLRRGIPLGKTLRWRNVDPNDELYNRLWREDFGDNFGAISNYIIVDE